MHLETPTVAVLAGIPEGFPGVVETLRAMKRFAQEGKKSLNVRLTAQRLVRGCGQKDASCEVAELHRYVRDDIRYLMDIDGVETLQTPEKTLEFGSGDCDDKATLLAALLGSIGYKSRFVAVGFEPQVFSHVYAEVLLGHGWVALETTEPVDMGWEPDRRLIFAGPYYQNV